MTSKDRLCRYKAMLKTLETFKEKNTEGIDFYHLFCLTATKQEIKEAEWHSRGDYVFHLPELRGTHNCYEYFQTLWYYPKDFDSRIALLKTVINRMERDKKKKPNEWARFKQFIKDMF